MKLQVTQENLSRALSNVARVAISSRGPLPILTNVLLKTDGNRLVLSATNLEIAITEKIGAKIETAGSITIPAKILQEYISSLPHVVLELELDDNKLSITADKYRSTINGVASDEFPVVPSIEGSLQWSINAKDLKKGLSQVVFSASNDETRPVLTGVYLHNYKGSIYIVATDSYRLAEKLLIKSDQEMSLLIPSTALTDLMRIIGDNDANVQISADDQQISFKIGDSELITRLIDGVYPEYRKLIPEECVHQALLARDEFLNITKVSALFAKESAGSITIKTDENKNLISIASIASQVGNNTSEATAKVSGSGEITLNSKYLIDALNAFNSKSIDFRFNGRHEPIVLTSGDVVDYKHVVMPLKS